jgi:hypothetical protein
MLTSPTQPKCLIKLSTGLYLCYPNTDRAIIYSFPTDEQDMRNDLNMTNGTLVSLTAELDMYIHDHNLYSNKRTTPELVEELLLYVQGNETFPL